jgi:hypothetical protein
MAGGVLAAVAGQPRKGGSLITASGDALVPDLSYGNAFGPQGSTVLQWIWPLFRTKPASFEIINALADRYTRRPIGSATKSRCARASRSTTVRPSTRPPSPRI